MLISCKTFLRKNFPYHAHSNQNITAHPYNNMASIADAFDLAWCYHRGKNGSGESLATRNLKKLAEILAEKFSKTAPKAPFSKIFN